MGALLPRTSPWFGCICLHENRMAHRIHAVLCESWLSHISSCRSTTLLFNKSNAFHIMPPLIHCTQCFTTIACHFSKLISKLLQQGFLVKTQLSTNYYPSSAPRSFARAHAHSTEKCDADRDDGRECGGDVTHKYYILIKLAEIGNRVCFR